MLDVRRAARARRVTPSHRRSRLSGAGANSIQPFFTRVFYYYSQANKGVSVNYSPAGSSVGVTDIQQNTVNFGDSEIPIKTPASGTGGNILQVPVDLGGVAISYNLPGVAAGLKLDGPTLAGIYPRQDHQVERLGHRRAQPRREPSLHYHRAGAPGRLVGSGLRPRPVPHRHGRIDVDELGSGDDGVDEMAHHQHRDRRAAQHRGGGLHPTDPGRHRLRRVRLFAAGGLHQRRAQERGGQLREAVAVEIAAAGAAGYGP